MDGLQDAARMLGQRSRRDLPFEPRFEPLAEPEGSVPSVAAVDGSHAVLVDNGAVWVVASRAAAIRWPGARRGDLPATITAATPDEAQSLVERRFGAHGLEPPRVPSAEALGEAVRAVLEFEAARDAIRDAPEGSLVLLDGALERLPAGPAAMVDRLLEAARSKGVHLVGVAKRSGLHADGVPLVPLLRRRGIEALPGLPWSASVPQHAMARVCLLHPRAPHAFRVDADAPEAFAALLPLSRDAVYTGYPYPLALVHNAVALTRPVVNVLRERLRDEVRRQGGADADALVADFHDVLDRNVPR